MSKAEIQVLLVEDNPGDARLVREMARETGLIFHHRENLSDGIEHLKKHKTDVILLDLGLPESNGLDTLHRVLGQTTVVPIVVLTGNIDEESGQLAVQEGAQDYLYKGRVDEYLLLRSIRYAIQRKKSEVALLESEARFRRIYEDSPVAYQSLDPEGNILDVNPAWLALLGYQREEVIGQRVDTFFTPASKELFAERFPLYLHLGVVHGAEFELISSNSSNLTVAIDGVFVRDLNGAPLYSHCILHNITERKRAEKELATLNLELEERVRERTANLESFTYTVSHDLRAPLRAIKGLTSILREGHASNLNAVGLNLLEMIIASVGKLEQLLDALFQFSRVSRQGMNILPVDMVALAKDVCNELLADEARERILCRVDKLPEATGDPDLLRQVWVNLLSNAVKFTLPKSGGMIEVGGDLNEKEAVYYVKDNGAGFDMHYSAKLFNIFQRLHSTKEFEGTGVGLSIVKKIIERHGGRVWAEGSKGHGAKFSFSLPRSVGSAPK